MERGRFTDQRREADAGAGDRLLAVELGPAETAFQPEHDTTEAAVTDEEVVASAEDLDRQLLPLRKREREPDVLDVLRDDEDVGRPSDAKGGVEAEGFLEPDFASDLSEHALPPVALLVAVGEALEELDPQLSHITGSESQHQIARPRGFAQILDDALAISIHVEDFSMTVSGNPLGQVARVDAGNRRLTRRIDVHDDQHLGLVERRQELPAQMVRTAVEVRLEPRDVAPCEARLSE